MIRRARRNGLGEMMKRRRERIEKGSREGIEKRAKRQFKEEGMRAPISSSPQGMTSWSSSIKIWFLQAYRMHY